MAKSDGDKDSGTRAELENAQTNLFEAYLSSIQKGYQTLNFGQRRVLINDIDLIIGRLEEKFYHVHRNTGVKQSCGRVSSRKNLSFDEAEAKRIRKKEGLSLAGLIKEIGFRNQRSAYAQIEVYESGRVKPSNPPRGEYSKKYVNWLKGHGYNPFKL